MSVGAVWWIAALVWVIFLVICILDARGNLKVPPLIQHELWLVTIAAGSIFIFHVIMSLFGH